MSLRDEYLEMARKKTLLHQRIPREALKKNPYALHTYKEAEMVLEVIRGATALRVNYASDTLSTGLSLEWVSGDLNDETMFSTLFTERYGSLVPPYPLTWVEWDRVYTANGVVNPAIEGAAALIECQDIRSIASMTPERFSQIMEPTIKEDRAAAASRWFFRHHQEPRLRWLMSLSGFIKYKRDDVVRLTAGQSFWLDEDGHLCLGAFVETPEIMALLEADRLAKRGSARAEELYRKDQLGSAYCACVSLWAFSLLHCNNILLEDRAAPEGAQKTRRIMGKLPLTEYKVLTLDPLKTPKVRAVRGEAGGPTRTVRLHTARGHFREYGTNGRGKLFGKITGRFYMPPTLRGAASAGVITKDYALGRPHAAQG